VNIDDFRAQLEPPWKADAECRRRAIPTGDFYPGTYGALSAYELLRGVCRACSVRAECLAYAMDFERGEHHTMRHGVWGGLTPRERFTLSRRYPQAQIAGGRMSA